jgi:hypothetical protein
MKRARSVVHKKTQRWERTSITLLVLRNDRASARVRERKQNNETQLYVGIEPNIITISAYFPPGGSTKASGYVASDSFELSPRSAVTVSRQLIKHAAGCMHTTPRLLASWGDCRARVPIDREDRRVKLNSRAYVRVLHDVCFGSFDAVRHRSGH